MMRLIRSTLLFVCMASSAVGSGMFAADWPQYRGPQRNDVSSETGLLEKWPADGPSLLWTYDNAGIGYSGLAVVEDRLYTIGGRGNDEYLITLDISAGHEKPPEIWSVKVGPLFQWEGNRWSAGPSATPTVHGDLIFAQGGMGNLICVAKDGQERWRKSLPTDLDAEVNPIGGGPKKLGWGFTASPLVDGERLICIPGGPKGTLAALNKQSGEVLWRSTEVTDQAAYTSPVVAELEGVRQYIVLTNQGVIGVGATDGRLLWKYERRYSTEVVNTPIVDGSLVYVTVGAGQGCDLIQIARDGETWSAKPQYANKNMTNHHGNTLLSNGHIFGYSEGKGWICQNLMSGEIVWAEKSKLSAGSTVFADRRLYCYDEGAGAVVLVEASTAGWKESGRFTIPQQSKQRKPGGKIWTPPIISGGRLFLRDQELLFCYRIKADEN